ncbi:MAG: hypothetical protein RQ966_04825 [Acetobacteraceae bacterium]|nr:hypothetical protein [Acetobacteraceae bacterium]
MTRTPPTLDMRLDGSFNTPPRAGLPLSYKMMIGGILVALTAGAVAFAALALWVLSMALPVIIVAGLFAWGMMRYRRWQAMRAAAGSRSLY